MTTKRTNPRKDVNERAFDIVQQATGEDEPEQSDKNQAAVELGRLGGSKGGQARAKKLTSEERSEIAKKAAEARWSKQSIDD